MFISSLCNKIITSEKLLNGNVSLTVNNFSNKKITQYTEDAGYGSPVNNEGFNILGYISALIEQHEYNADNITNLDDLYLCKLCINSTNSPDSSDSINYAYYFFIEKQYLNEDLLKKFDYDDIRTHIFYD